MDTTNRIPAFVLYAVVKNPFPGEKHRMVILMKNSFSAITTVTLVVGEDGRGGFKDITKTRLSHMLHRSLRMWDSQYEKTVRRRIRAEKNIPKGVKVSVSCRTRMTELGLFHEKVV